MSVNEYLLIIVAGIFVNNFVLAQFLGICAFLGVSQKTETALGMGFAVIFVMGIASIATFAVDRYILVPLDLVYIRTIAFIVIIAGLVQLVEIIIKKLSPALYSALGIYLPLITTNCAVLGVAIVNVEIASYTLLAAFMNGIFSGVGFTLAMLLLAGIREKLRRSDVPEPFKGFPVTLA
ncbi:MAG: electron transport complex protein RnfA, partial [Christensenellales bacterium]